MVFSLIPHISLPLLIHHETIIFSGCAFFARLPTERISGENSCLILHVSFVCFDLPAANLNVFLYTYTTQAHASPERVCSVFSENTQNPSDRSFVGGQLAALVVGMARHGRGVPEWNDSFCENSAQGNEAIIGYLDFTRGGKVSSPVQLVRSSKTGCGSE